MQLAYPQNDTRAETLRYLGAGGWQPDAASQVLLQKAEDALRAAADAIAAKLEGLVLPIVMRVGDNDKLYGSVTTAIIGDALAAQDIEVDRRRILIDHPIRTLGDHPVRVRLHADVIASLTVKVVSEDKAHLVEEEAAEAPAEAPAEEAAE